MSWNKHLVCNWSKHVFCLCVSLFVNEVCGHAKTELNNDSWRESSLFSILFVANIAAMRSCCKDYLWQHLVPSHEMGEECLGGWCTSLILLRVAMPPTHDTCDVLASCVGKQMALELKGCYASIQLKCIHESE